MTSETAAIPDPPREVRWKTCLARRWVLGLIGGLFALAGLAVLVASWLQAGNSPFDDSVLDSGAWTASGTIHAVEELANGTWQVRYEFESAGHDVLGASYARTRASGMRVGEPCKIEYLPDRPDINRMRGTSRALFDEQRSTLVTVLVILGMIALYTWIRGALSLRIALREGRLTTAQVIEAKVLRHVNPRPVRVHYRFEDALGMEHIAIHCVGVHTELGRNLLDTAPREHPVIHDEGNPAISRLVHAEDFLA